MLVRLTLMEFKLFGREVVLLLFVFALPVALLLGFGFQPGSRHADPHLGGQTGAEYVAALGAGIAPAILGLSVLPTTLAGYRERGGAAADGDEAGAAPQTAYLRGRLQWAGMTATAFVVSATYVGGFDRINARTLPLYLAFSLVTTALGAAFTHFAHKQTAMVAALSQAKTMLEETLEETLEENAGLHAQLLVQAREAGVLDERQRMVREIHDTLAQGFTGIIAQLEAARHNPDEWRRHAEQAQALARDNLAEARRSVEALRPPRLEHARLPEAIAGMAERWSAGSGVPAGVETTGRPRPMLPDIEVALFRVAQEALTNVAYKRGLLP